MIGPNETPELELISEPLNIEFGKRRQVELRFLEEALSRFQYPEITRLELHFEGMDIDGSGNNLAGEDVYRVVQRLELRDGSIPRINGSGMSVLRPMSIEALGPEHLDPDAVTTDNSDYDAIITVPFEWPYRSMSEKDTRIPVQDLLVGQASLWITFGAATLGLASPPTITQAGTLEVYAYIKERGKAVAPVRWVWEENGKSPTLAKDRYVVQGALHTAILQAPDANGPGYNSIASLTTIDSVALNYSGRKKSLLVRDYRRGGQTFSGDEVVAGNYFPVVTPSRDQKLISLREVNSMDLEFNAAPPTDSVLSQCRIVPRDPEVSYRHMGFATAAQYVAALQTRGRAKTEGNGAKAWAAWAPHLRHLIPWEIPGLAR